MFALTEATPVNSKVTIPTIMPLSSPTQIPPTSAPTLPSVPTSTPAVDPTASWPIFSNTQYGYTIKYPPDWIATDSGSLEPLVPDYVVFNPIDATSSASITISYTTRTADELAAIYTSPTQTLTIASQSATLYDQKDSDGNQTTSVVLSLASNGFVFFSTAQYQSTLLQMLGTLNLTK